MKVLKKLIIDFGQCKIELDEFDELLQNNELGESKDILPFFRARENLSAFTGSTLFCTYKSTEFANEFPLFGDFVCDLISYDGIRNQYSFIEFEDAKKDSVFKINGNKATHEWSPRFEHGFSQLIDWFWMLSDMKNTTKFSNMFRKSGFSYHGLLVIGRDHFLNQELIGRLNWRKDYVRVDSKAIECLTYDELARQLRNRLDVIIDVMNLR